ncbi:MAG: hypothetical protein NUW01_17545 [Gemmatimonadaceae bacterium]|nr:hypothetical protein [Gemmatimonadaceae bacterium]
MALNTYAALQSAVLDWMTRSELTGQTADWITLAEAKLNRELPAVTDDNTLTGTSSSREISTSAISVVEPIGLWLVDSGTGDEREITKKDGFAYLDDTNEPSFWEFDDDATAPKIKFDVKLDAAYSFRFRSRNRFALSGSATTNWLLTNHPDIYLAATIVWGGGYTANYEQAATFKLMLEEGIPEVRNIIAQGKRGILTVDPALASVNLLPYYDGTE